MSRGRRFLLFLKHKHDKCLVTLGKESKPMSTGSAHLYHTTHPSSAGEVQHCFPTELPLGSVVPACTSEIVQCIEVLHCTGTANALHLRCTSIWVCKWMVYQFSFYVMHSQKVTTVHLRIFFTKSKYPTFRQKTSMHKFH